MLYIVLVEDEYLDGDRTCSLLRGVLTIGEMHIEWLDTEHAFREWLAKRTGPPPDLVILDVRLPWTNPSPVMEPTPDGYAGSDEAGIRCYHLLRTHADCAKVPVILLTHTEVAVPEGAAILAKGERLTRMADVVRDLLCL